MAGRKDTSGAQRLTKRLTSLDQVVTTFRDDPSWKFVCESNFLRYAGHTDTEKVFLCATSCLSSLPSQCMFYFNFLRVFQRIVMSHMIFVNWHCQISMLLWQLWKFAATFTLLHINEKIFEKRHAIPYKNFAVVLFLFWQLEKTTQALALSINGHL